MRMYEEMFTDSRVFDSTWGMYVDEYEDLEVEDLEKYEYESDFLSY